MYTVTTAAVTTLEDWITEQRQWFKGSLERESDSAAHAQAVRTNDNDTDTPDNTMQHFAAFSDYVPVYEPRDSDNSDLRHGDSPAPAPALTPQAGPPTR